VTRNPIGLARPKARRADVGLPRASPAAGAPALAVGAAVVAVAALVMVAARDVGARALRAVGGQSPGQARLVVTADTTPVTVGDPLVVHVLVHLPPGAELPEAVPRLRTPLAEGVQLVAVDSLRRTSGTDAIASLRVVFFRPGAAEIPALVVSYRPAPGAPFDSLVGASRPLVVRRIVPPTTGTLRDIKDIETAPLSLETAAVIGGVFLVTVSGVAVGIVLSRRRRARAAAARGRAMPAALPGPYERAVAQLAEIAAADWATRGDAARHYAQTTDVLRQYLADAHRVPARECTTPELLLAMPPALASPALREAARTLLDRADLVKFARLTPGPASAVSFLADARALLVRWDALRRTNGHGGHPDRRLGSDGVEPMDGDTRRERRAFR
jgi:hypothetical protein